MKTNVIPEIVTMLSYAGYDLYFTESDLMHTFIHIYVKKQIYSCIQNTLFLPDKAGNKIYF